MGLVSDTGFLAPLIVALVAVWLGYLYQKEVFDREARREAYLKGYSALFRLTELISLEEQTEYLVWSTLKVLSRESAEAETKLRQANRFIQVLSSTAGLLGLDTDFTLMSGSDLLSNPSSSEELSGRIIGRLRFEAEQRRQKLGDAIIGASSGAKLGLFHRSVKPWKVIETELHTGNYLMAVFQSLSDPKSPCRVDWGRVDAMMSDLQTIAAEDLGVSDHATRSIAPSRNSPRRSRRASSASRPAPPRRS